MATAIDTAEKEKEVPSEIVYCLSYNQDSTSIALGTNFGYKIFQFDATDSVQRVCQNVTGDASIIERLFQSNLVAVVSTSSPRTLLVCHLKKNYHICNYSYPSSILSVKLNRKHLVVSIENTIYIHQINSLSIIHQFNYAKSSTGLIALSPCQRNSLLAYPASNIEGHVQLYDCSNICKITLIKAHRGMLRAISFNESGTKLATASEKGTIVRIFDVQTGLLLQELRRGLKPVSINSLSFALQSNFVVVSSNSGTVHIFRLDENLPSTPAQSDDNPQQDDSGWMNWLTKTVSNPTEYMPGSVTQMMLQERAFATVCLPFSDVRNITTITKIKNVPYVLIVTFDGYLYIYDINTEEGGECRLVTQHRLIEDKVEVKEPVREDPPSEVSEDEKIKEISSAMDFTNIPLDDQDEFPQI